MLGLQIRLVLQLVDQGRSRVVWALAPVRRDVECAGEACSGTAESEQIERIPTFGVLGEQIGMWRFAQGLRSR